MKQALFIFVAASLSLGLLAGCGEERPAVAYKQGVYQGKPDTDPWNNEQFKGEKAAWEHAIKQRNQAQNEYLRTHDGPGGKL